MKLQQATLFAVLSVGAMVAAIVIGLIVIGSPREFRMRRLDQRRADDLGAISSAIRTYRLTHENLPMKLDELQGSQQAVIYRLKDPVERPMSIRSRTHSHMNSAPNLIQRQTRQPPPAYYSRSMAKEGNASVKRQGRRQTGNEPLQ